jgi:hypothetical protein
MVSTYTKCTEECTDTCTGDTCNENCTADTCTGDTCTNYIACQKIEIASLWDDLSSNLVDDDVLDYVSSDKTYSQYLDSNSNGLTNSFSFFYNKTILEIVIDVVGIILIAIIGAKKILNNAKVPDVV